MKMRHRRRVPTVRMRQRMLVSVLAGFTVRFIRRMVDIAVHG